MEDRKKEILMAVLDNYLQSGDFNGMGVVHLTQAGDVELIKELIADGRLDLIRGDGHPNPHIKAFEAEPIDVQLEKIDEAALAGCLYPTPQLLAEQGAGASESAPYTRALMEGAPQLSFRAFDLRALEWYRNDPRFDFEVDDIHGRILQKYGTQVADRAVVQDGLEFFEFGFAYDKDSLKNLPFFA